MLECSYCERKIENEEKFYKQDDEYFCCDCIREEVEVTYKLIDEMEPLKDIECFESTEDLINYFERSIKNSNDYVEFYLDKINNCNTISKSHYKKLLIRYKKINDYFKERLENLKVVLEEKEE